MATIAAASQSALAAESRFAALAAPGFGTVVDKIRKLPRGQSYEIQLVHLGSSVQPPDLDYVAWVEVLGESSRVDLDDPDNILTPMPPGTPVDQTLPYMNSNVLPESFDDERAWLHAATVEILDAGQNKTDTLRVAKWENAFQGSPPVLQPTFIDQDADRFFVRVTDESNKGAGKRAENWRILLGPMKVRPRHCRMSWLI